ncbi:MAG: hypothetical protein E6H44_14845 [Betaproteobacteria bacterium]|nr:MAG: hypothetical protein E6H44_14845 [Betaproteobacteria bacterium]
MLQDQRDGDALRLHQARRAERTDVLRARRADRRCRPEGRRDARRPPGVGVAAAEWLAKQDPQLVGSDNWPVEVAPNPDKDLSLPVHQIFLVVNGIHILENLKLDELVAKRVYEFAFTMQPLKIYGASGSSVAPAAIR